MVLSSNPRSIWSQVFLCTLLLVLSISVVQVLIRQKDLQMFFEDVTRTLRKVEKDLEVASSRCDAGLHALKSGQAELRTHLINLSAGSSATAHTTTETVLNLEHSDVDSHKELNNLPPLPEGIIPKMIDKLGVAEILSDPRFNPMAKAKGNIAQLQITSEIAKARASRSALFSERNLAMAVAAQTLKDRGEFIDYTPGDEYIVEKGVLTSGEQTDSGQTRIFYLYPSEFPNIYEYQNQREEVGKLALRKIISIINEQ